MATDSRALWGQAKFGHYHDKDLAEVEKVKAIRWLKTAALSRRGELSSLLVNEMISAASEDMKKLLPDRKSLRGYILKWRKNN